MKEMVLKLTSRTNDEYEYENIKDMSKKDLVHIVTLCQGKKYTAKTKTEYKYPKEHEVNKMSTDDLFDMINEMTGREPGTYKVPCTGWSKVKLIDFILTCQGTPKPRLKGGTYFVGGGWSL